MTIDPAMHIQLIGFMCAGKSRIGRALAPLLDLPFHDLDRVIEQRTGPIRPFFERYGDQAFRAEESRALHEVLSKPPSVIAMGGGTPCYGGNFMVMRKGGLMVWLDVPLELLLSRIQRAGSDRPLLAGLTPDELRTYVTALLAEREPVYMQADLRIQATDTPEEIAAAIASRLQTR